MAITYYLLQIPPYLFFILITLLGGTVAGLSTWLFRKNIRMDILRSHNEVTGFLYLSISAFYSLLLGFVVFEVWGQMNESKNLVSMEGSSAMGLYRDIKFYPDTAESKLLMAAYLGFVYNVIDEEFPNMEHMKMSRKTPESLNMVFYKMEHLNPKNAYQIQLVVEMFSHLNALDRQRGLRISSMENEIAPPLWLPIIFGAIITLFCAMLLDIEHIRMHVVLSSLLGIFITMLLFLIILLDHPYAGERGIKPKSYRQIFTMEKWSMKDHSSKNIHFN